MQDLVKQAQMMQKKMAKMQEELNSREVEASAGGGMVTVRVNGGQEVLEVRIEKDVVDPEDVEMLQDLVLAATNDALKRAREMVQGEMSQITGGIKIPGLF
ncbi:YbaB/EbfC family nucleoid-associated protein [Desulfonatronospira sp.]|uniref:YbaB/EbfC family nucleoid-associated protein n=1 Tax=Desulfonatronospira sp. TaxID=1962951 RepID=UPI0025C4A40B|nr:YbaB/EbfC family nucleoid-associated protein [Desulfonatronospira sp.]